MRILSSRRNFDADHSSSTYEFFALNRLTPEQREAVEDLTGETARRHLHFKYWGDWGSLPSGWQDELLSLGYDVMVNESYDWWSIYLSLPHDPDLMERLAPYGCEYDGNGFDVREIDAVGEKRLLLYFGMSLDYSAVYDEFGEDAFRGLSDLFADVRDELLAGDLSAPWAMYETYGGHEDVEPDPVEPLSVSGDTLLNIMTTL